MKVHTRKLQKVNIQVKETNSKKVRIDHCGPFYPARGPEPSTRGYLGTETRGLGQAPVPGTGRLVHVGGSPSILPTSLPHHIRVWKVLVMAVLLQGHQSGWPG